jgi:hypothetical protein
LFRNEGKSAKSFPTTFDYRSTILIVLFYDMSNVPFQRGRGMRERRPPPISTHRTPPATKSGIEL